MKTDFRMKISSLISKVFTLLIALLGFSSCESEECMYGTPTGSFEIKGEVTDEKGDPVEGAVVKVMSPTITDSSSWRYYDATDTTDMSGRYISKGYSFPDDLKVVCVPQDNSLESDSTIITMNYSKDRKKDDPWYIGHAEAVVNFKLKNKKPADNNPSSEE